MRSSPSPAAGRKSLTYFNHDPRATLQEVTFDLPEVKKIFFGSFHKVLEGSRTTGVCLPQDPPPVPEFGDRPPQDTQDVTACHPQPPSHTAARPCVPRFPEESCLACLSPCPALPSRQMSSRGFESIPAPGTPPLGRCDSVPL